MDDSQTIFFPFVVDNVDNGLDGHKQADEYKLYHTLPREDMYRSHLNLTVSAIPKEARCSLLLRAVCFCALFLSELQKRHRTSTELQTSTKDSRPYPKSETLRAQT